MPEVLTPEEKENVVVFAGNTHPDLAADIAAGMQVPLGPRELSAHPDTSVYARLDESVRGKQVVLIQTIAAANGKDMSHSFDELTELINAAYESDADRTKITALVPHFPSRQDRQARPGESVSLKKSLRILQAVGVRELVTVTPHAPVKTFFDERATVLTAEHLLRDALSERMTGDREGYVVVSPDAGHTPSAEDRAAQLGLEVVTVPKKRDKLDRTRIERPDRIDGVDGLTCFILDDMIDTAGTLVSAAETLRNSGAKEIYAAATHGVFSDPGLERIEASPIDGVLITDTLPLDRAREALGDKLQVVPVGCMIADSMVRIIQGRSVSETEAGQSYR